jgi:phytoene dehydrogenase-like protein
MGHLNLEKHTNENIAKYFKRTNTIDYSSGTMKINCAVSRLPNFLADPNINESPMPHHQTTIHMNGENMRLLDEAYKDLKYSNKPSSKPMIEMVIPSALDPTLAPKGSHVVLLFCQYFPLNRSIKSNNYKEEYAKIVFDSIENYAPGFKNSIIGKDVLTPLDLENEFNLTGGNIFHGAMPLNQLFISRPVAEYMSYTTPIENLYLSGSGAHPGGQLFFFHKF